jgi:hypothetical protein
MASLPPVGARSVAPPQAPPVGRKEQVRDGDQDDQTRLQNAPARTGATSSSAQKTGSMIGTILDITA